MRLYYGCPRVFLSDSGSVFVSKAITYLFKRYGIRVDPSSSYHHRTIGLVERWHSTLKHLLLAHRASAPDIDWGKSLPLLNLAFNTVVNRCTQVAPSFALNLREVRLPSDLFYTLPTIDSSVSDLPGWVSDMLEAAHISYNSLSQTLYLNTLANKKKFDLRRDTSLSFKVGDKVLVVKGQFVDNVLPKAETPTTGPFTVCKVLPNDNYLLSGRGANRFRTHIHVDRLLPFLEERSDESVCRTPVEAIVAHRLRTVGDRRVVEYRVRWLGFTKSYDRWLSVEYLTDVPHLVEAYCRYHNLPFNLSSADFEPPPAVPVSLPPQPLSASGRHHFRTHPDTNSLPPGSLESDPTIPSTPALSQSSATAPQAPLAPAGPHSSEPMAADGADLLLSPSQVTLDETPQPPPPVDVEGSSLPFVAKRDNKGRWIYGCHRVSSRGLLSTRWVLEDHFLQGDLDSTHFSALRALASDEASPSS